MAKPSDRRKGSLTSQTMNRNVLKKKKKKKQPKVYTRFCAIENFSHSLGSLEYVPGDKRDNHIKRKYPQNYCSEFVKSRSEYKDVIDSMIGC